jgi:cupin superfamily acireductone dioxygenase involved in methionine salvage
MRSLSVLKGVVRELDPNLARFFDDRKANYSVADTETLLGELKQERGYHSLEIFFSSQSFLKDFPEALAIFLHEHAHIFGYDGSRGFTDALTGLLEAVVRHRQQIEVYEAQWEAARNSVLQDRARNHESMSEKSVEEVLSAMSPTELKALLLKIPPVAVRRAMEGNNKT